jgi:tRNA threonylcarbamoyladenosine biosynthesis protein TsaB
MYVLGIESATTVASVAVTTEEGLLAERMVLNKRTHSVNLLPMIKAVLGDAEIKKNDLTGIAVSAGPGSFTGLRIGMSIAKTLAQVLKLPLVGISTLQGLAHVLTGYGNLVCPIMNARKNEVYTAGYIWTGSEQTLLIKPQAQPVDSLIDLLKGYNRSVTFLGDAVAVYERQLKEGLCTMATFAPGAVIHPRGGAIAELGLSALVDGKGTGYLELQPEYIRFSEAEVLWRKRQSAGG